jgi:hypothetical protein
LEFDGRQLGAVHGETKDIRTRIVAHHVQIEFAARDETPIELRDPDRLFAEYRFG